MFFQIKPKTLPAFQLFAGSTGCATQQEQPNIKVNRLTGLSLKIPAVVKQSPRFFRKDRSGYWVDRFAKPSLNVAAGLITGTVEINKTSNGYILQGFYSQFANPEAYRKAAELADVNGDGAVTVKEARDFLNREIEVYTSGQK